MENKDEITLSPEEIDEIREGGKIWQKVKQELVAEVKEGVSGADINRKAVEIFKKYEVEPAFFNYHDFPGHICVSVNDCIIHGVGNDTPLQKTDKITLDIGFKHKSVYIDSAVTVIVEPESNPEYQKFVNKCHKALWAGIKIAKSIKENKQVLKNGDIASAIEGLVRSWNDNKISLIDGYVGHTIGKALHQRPNVFNKGLKKGEGDILYPNRVICIEPMLLKQTTGEFAKGKNSYDIVSKVPGVFTCHWEHMVLIKEDGIEVLTATPEEIKEYLV
ncbi:M24 family metallopeptidase [Candidatus Mycoplasma haematohominis]|uniref:Methionine aminopeptidase 1 n=1 Tax=Candidatus Mycoplasma haematohominis TaxID=1494318 RepID=A0A478FUF0_9MOLU|nr:M24 family metallopeptidase [Candidatus Mycoplasma haemohominis]GCE63956.1 methionine aminopeptidase 1 [Candidatus Mycoplasma haemohominis]